MLNPKETDQSDHSHSSVLDRRRLALLKTNVSGGGLAIADVIFVVNQCLSWSALDVCEQKNVKDL
ncbi:hypothetical protein HY798_02915 [Candidatus Falkowbacteria bacterium]|nr:hypothetical protein [Candidatus Falkowbacteria bacterium]